MKNVLRTLVYNGQVSLTIANTTEMVKKGISLHKLSKNTAKLFGRTLSAMTFMSACLKDEKGEISLSIKSEGDCEEIAVSGNQALKMRGYILANETETPLQLGKNGSLTIIRDDGYNRPFVGSCALHESGDIDKSFEEYYRISEQLPTKIATMTEFSIDGKLLFSGVAVLQPLPFADSKTLENVENFPLYELVADLANKDVEKLAREHFDVDGETLVMKEGVYQCNCSRERIRGVLVSLGEEQMRNIIKEDGEVKVHCHYCNTDYAFFDADADEMFKK